MRKLAAEELFEYSVRYLGLRACSSEELRTRLRARAASLADVDATISRLKEIGYLNDQRFAESFAANRVENNGFGRMRVLNDLRSRRVTGHLAESAVEQAFEGKTESGLIDAYIERRMPSIFGRKVEDERKLMAAYRRLRRAGFSSGGIMTALKRLAARPELIDEPPEEEAPEDESPEDKSKGKIEL